MTLKSRYTAIACAVAAVTIAGCEHGTHSTAAHQPIAHAQSGPTPYGLGAHHRLWIKERPIVVVHFRNAKRVYYHYTVKNDLPKNVHHRTDYKRQSSAVRPYAKVVCGRHLTPCPK